MGGGTARTMRVYWAADELDINYQPVLIGSRSGDTNTPEFHALNVKEKIPVLMHDDFVLTESGAIVNYLGRIKGGLLPESVTDWARYEEWQSYLLMELDAQYLYPIRKHRDLAHIYGEAPAAITAAIEGFHKQIKFAEVTLNDNPFLMGDSFTGVDIHLTTCLEWAQMYQIELNDIFIPYLDRVRARPAYQKAFKLNFSITPDGKPVKI